jgi:hypothetical protein
MRATLQADEKGALHIPASLLPQSAPLAEYDIEEKAGQIVIAKKHASGERAFWETASPEQRVKALREWVDGLPPGPGLSDYAVSRDSIYD